MTIVDEPVLGSADPFAASEALAADLRELAERHDVGREQIVAELLAIHAALISEPRTAFPEPPEYRREDLTGAAYAPAMPARSTHGFFDVVGARASRRDYGDEPLDAARLMGVLHWTFGARGTEIAYDYRDAPLRYIPSAGGLASIDAYVVVSRVDGVDAGAYYFDYTKGLVEVSRGRMLHRLAAMNPGQEWVTHAGAVIVLVSNTDRVARKYGAMGGRLALMDAGVAAGHIELVAAALELRSCIIGGLPSDDVRGLLRLSTDRVPVGSVVLGTRGAHTHG